MLDFVIELPHHCGNETSTMGGLLRLMKLAKELWTVELPHCNYSTGGVRDSIILSETMKTKLDVCLRFQKRYPNVDYEKLDIKIPYSIGLPDATFPASKVAITYSDTPYGKELTSLPQVKKVAIYMLSYGMALERERQNILNPKMTIMTTTKRTKQLIEKETKKICHQVGFGTDYENFYIEPSLERKKIAVLLYHWATDKRYKLGVKIVNKLIDEKLIEGVITFGTATVYDQFEHPKKLIRHYFKARRAEVREIFNIASLFIMPSVTEGLNLTPMEATLCGCPAILCDGAINDIYFDNKNCFVAQKDNFEEMYKKSKLLLSNQNYSFLFRNDMSERIKMFTWEKTVKNIINLLT